VGTALGRSVKYGPARMEALINAAAKGWSRTMVANAGGIDSETLRKWLSQGMSELMAGLEQDEDYIPVQYTKAWFYLQYEAASFQPEALATQKLLLEMTDLEKGDWKAAAWWLERKQKDTFGKQVVQRHVGADGGPIQIQHVEIVQPKFDGVDIEIIDAQAYMVEDDS
jgi:hypothetical protein